MLLFRYLLFFVIVVGCKLPQASQYNTVAFTSHLDVETEEPLSTFRSVDSFVFLKVKDVWIYNRFRTRYAVHMYENGDTIYSNQSHPVYYLFQDGYDSGMMFDSDSNQVVMFNVLKFKRTRPFFDFSFVSEFDHLVNVRKNGDTLVRYYQVNDPPDKSYPDSTILFYSKDDIPFSFNPGRDTVKGRKLTKGVMVYNADNEQGNVKPRREYAFSLRKSSISKLIIDSLVDRYRTASGILVPRQKQP